MAYVDGDNYVKFDAITDVDNTRINRIELRSEVAGVIQEPQSNATYRRGQAVLLAAADQDRHQLRGPVLLRRHGLDRDAEQPGDERDGRAGLRPVRVQPAGGRRRRHGVVRLLHARRAGPAQRCEQCNGPGDEFNGDRARHGRFNAIVRPTTRQVRRRERQAEDHHRRRRHLHRAATRSRRGTSPAAADQGEDYVLETKLDVTQLNGGYAQGGILVRADDDNYVKFDAISDVDNPKFNRIELRSESGGRDPEPAAAGHRRRPGRRDRRLAAADQDRHHLHRRVLARRRRLDRASAPVTNAQTAPRSASSRSACRSPIASSASSTSRSTARRAARPRSPRTTRR